MWNDFKRLLAHFWLECTVIKCLSAIIRWCLLTSIYAVSAVFPSRLLFHLSLSLTVARTSFGKMKPCGPLILFCLISPKAYSTCYFPNGTDANKSLPSPVFQPCDSGGGDSMCCALNRSPPDKCRSDGLCESQLDLNIWRESCTDRSWKSPKCIQLCINGICMWIPSPRTRLASNDFWVQRALQRRRRTFGL